MQLLFQYLITVKITILVFLASGAVYSENYHTNTNTSPLYNYRGKSQALSQNNREFDVKQLNEQAIKLSGQGNFKDALQRLETALAISRDIGDRPWEAVTLQIIPKTRSVIPGARILIVLTEKPIQEKLDQTLDQAVVLGKKLTRLRKIPSQQRSPQQKQRVEQLANQQQLLVRFNNFITSPPVKSQLEQNCTANG